MPTDEGTVKWSKGTSPPIMQVPFGSVDCHHHIYDHTFPAVTNAALLPGDASIHDYRLLQKRLGTSRNVMIQPSTYGLDNTLLVASLRQFGNAARGICVVRPDIADHEFDLLHEAGVRGVRFNMVTKGGILSFDMIAPLADRIASRGWHIQLNISPDDIMAQQAVLENLPCPIVFDHMAHLSGPDMSGHPAFAILVDLMKRQLAWVKLSAPYNDTQSGPPDYKDRGHVAQRLVQAAPDRLVWGSDWPHPTESDDNKPDDAAMLDLLLSWAPEMRTRNRILVQNPEELYGF